MKNNFLCLLAAAILTFGLTACNSSTEKSTPAENAVAAQVYQCPMQCEGEKTYDKAGQCPVCKMDLETPGGHEHGAEDHSGHQH